MISAREYFERFLGYRMGSISSDNLSMHNCFYESYRNLGDQLLEMHMKMENNPAAIEELGERKYYTDRDIPGAVEYLKKASEMGDGEASLLLSQIYRMDLVDWNQYFKYIELAASQGSGMAMFNLSCCYYKGKEGYEGNGFDQDKKKALECSLAAADRCRDLISVFMSIRAAKSFQEYWNQLMQVYIQCISVSSQQLIEGDGVLVDKDKAGKILTEANSFFKQLTGQDCNDFVYLLNSIR